MQHRTDAYILFSFQVIALFSLPILVIYGEWYQYAITFVLYFIWTCFGGVMTYHRLLSHRSWNTPKWLEYTLAFITTFGLIGSAIAWVALHRAHHKYADTEKDPHSVIHLGAIRVHFCSMFANISPKFAIDLIRDKFYLFQHKNYFTLNIIYAIILYLIDPFSVIYAWLAPAALTWNLGSLVLSVSHRNGNIHNDIWITLLTWGDGYHKVHHNNPGLNHLGKYDIAGWIINKLEKMNGSQR